MQYYTSMASRWGYHDGMSPEGGWFSRGRSPRENHHPEGDIPSYYTSRENTLIPFDESHVSKLLATCVSVGSLTAVTIRRISTRCQGNDVLAPVVKVPFHDSLYC